MNRREFFKALGVGLAGLAAVPLVDKLEVPKKKQVADRLMMHCPSTDIWYDLGEYKISGGGACDCLITTEFLAPVMMNCNQTYTIYVDIGNNTYVPYSMFGMEDL